MCEYKNTKVDLYVAISRDLSFNRLTGVIPVELRSLTKLKYM